jgi:teichuronic acid biosynthesis glycosyltransferase TuaG
MTRPHVEGLVSIITPAYNAEPFIRETIESVRSQTCYDWEWIIADDGSDDDTATIISEAAASDKKIKVVMMDGHSGIAARVRNRALAEARGEFIAFLDADDLWRPEKLARQIAYLHKKPDADGVCCRYDVIGDTDAVDRTRKMLRWETETVCSRDEVLRGCPFQTSTVVFRRTCYDEIGGMDEDTRLRATEDTEYFARLVDRYEFHRMNDALSYYRVTLNSYSNELMDAHQSPAWRLLEVMSEKGFYTPAEARRKKGHVYYEQAKDNLFHAGGPFRPFLVQSILSGHAPAKAYAILALSVLPAAALRRFLLEAGGVMWRWRTRKAGTADV